MNAPLFWATTSDGWANFELDQMPTVGAQNPSVAYDRFENAFWACWLLFDGGTHDVYYSKSETDGSGNRFFDNECAVHTAPSDTSRITVGKRPGTITDSNLYVTWHSASNDNIFFRRSISDGTGGGFDCNGRSWELALVLSDQYAGGDVEGQGPMTVVSPGDPEILYVVYWVNPEVDGDERIEIVKTLDTGASFGTGQQGDAPLEVADLQETGSWFAGWLGAKVDGGELRVPKFPSAVGKRGATLLVEKVFIVWADVDAEETVCDTGQTDVDIHMARLTSSTGSNTMTVDNGFPKVISADPTGQGEYECADQWFPWMTIDGDGDLHVVYYDNRSQPEGERYDDSDENHFDLYYTFSGDDGDTWCDPLRVTTTSSFIDNNFPRSIGHYIGVSSSLDPEQPRVNAAFMQALDEQGSYFEQEMWVADIDPGCP